MLISCFLISILSLSTLMSCYSKSRIGQGQASAEGRRVGKASLLPTQEPAFPGGKENKATLVQIFRPKKKKKKKTQLVF